MEMDRKIVLNEHTDDPGSPLRPGATSMLPITYPGSPCKTDSIPLSVSATFHIRAGKILIFLFII